MQIAGDLLPAAGAPETAGREALALEMPATWQAGAPFQGRDKLPPGHRPPPPHPSSAKLGCWEGFGFLPPAGLSPPPRGQVPLERALDFVTRPLGTDSWSDLFSGRNLFTRSPPSVSVPWERQLALLSACLLIEEETEALREDRDPGHMASGAGSRTDFQDGQIWSPGNHLTLNNPG